MVIFDLFLLLVGNSAIPFSGFTQYKHTVIVRNKDFIAFFITLENRVASLIMSDLFDHGHKNVVISHGPSLFFYIFLFLCLFL